MQSYVSARENLRPWAILARVAAGSQIVFPGPHGNADEVLFSHMPWLTLDDRTGGVRS